MNDGRILQVGTPEDVYLRPRNRFVAEFVGLANFLEGRWVGPGRFETGGVVLQVADVGAPGARAVLAVRPEEVRVHVDAPEGSPNLLRGHIRSITFLGSVRRCTVETDGSRWLVDVPRDLRLQTAQEVYVDVPPDRLRVVEGA
ncbi:MAG: TOBE domain-containing protein [Armatimonadota bacterium]|nr:TOBE domain-containing protein [Armatimonadota bacterium]